MMNGHVNPIQVQKFLGGLDYPVNKEQLIQTAEEQGADENVIGTLEDLPMKEFTSPNDVSKEIGKLE